MVDLFQMGTTLFLYAGGPTIQLCQDYHWRYMVVLQDNDLLNVHRNIDLLQPFVPENHKRLRLDKSLEIMQNYRWLSQIGYTDSQYRKHQLNILTYQETKPTGQGGRIRWKIENEGFNLEHPDSQHLNYPLLVSKASMVVAIKSVSILPEAYRHAISF
jgi:hypothetical protein